MTPKICYVCCVYLGERRHAIESYKKDKSLYIKEHIISLEEFEHNLNKIIFIFNLNGDHLTLFDKIKKIIPKKIKNTDVEVIVRENYGMSYAANNDVYEKYRTDFDYYIFTEDDYYFNQHNFDRYLVNKFNSYNNIGFLSAMVSNPAWGFFHDTPHAGNSVGITSSKILEELYNKFGFLPHSRKTYGNSEEIYESNETDGQVAQTHEIFKMGYNLFDVREDYSTPHDMGFKLKNENPEFDHFVDLFFHWNQTSLVIPASIRFNAKTFFIYVTDAQFQKKRSCYILYFNFKNEYTDISESTSDKLFFLKKQIENLNTYHHNLDKIIFIFHYEKLQYNIISEAINLTPKIIKNASVELQIHESTLDFNQIISEIYGKKRNDFDYFIFNTEDYFLADNNWDEYLIRKYHTLPNTGYLCLALQESTHNNIRKFYSEPIFGISSTSSLNKIWNEYKCLPYYEQDETHTDIRRKINFTYTFNELGLRVYDVREDYRVYFKKYIDKEHNFVKRFSWNNKDLVLPDLMYLNKPYSWWESYDEKSNIKTNLENYEKL